MEQKSKVAKLNENPIGNEEEQVDNIDGRDDNDICYMDELPNEILMKILDYLNEQQLVKCRLVNPHWNEISCSLLRDKSKNNPDSKLVVQVRRGYGPNYLMCKTVTENSLEDFIYSFSPIDAEKSSGSDSRRPFPFSRFNIQDFPVLKESQILQLISAFGTHLKFLTLEIKEGDCDNFQTFWKLLLEFAPNIQHLGISGGLWLNKLNLFETASGSNENVNVNTNIKEENQENGASFLQNLKSIKVTRDNGFDEFMKNLLNHAPNVKEVMSSDFPSNSVQGLENFVLWQRLEKSHLIKKFEMMYFDDSTNHLPPAELMKNVRLDYLNADCGIYSVPMEKVISYIAHAMKSSQDSLSTLKLKNVTTANMNSCFKGISSLQNVRKLQIEWRFDTGEEEIANTMSRLSQLCPNITHLIIDSLYCPFLRVAPILWAEFKRLKFLKISLCVNFDGKNDVLTLTSGVSGYSKESLKTIEEKLEQGISLVDARRDEEQESSIFDLKDLSRLEMVCLFPKRSYEIEDEKKEVEESLLGKILPQHIRENPRTFDYRSTMSSDSEFDDHQCECCRHCCEYCSDPEYDEDDSDLE